MDDGRLSNNNPDAATDRTSLLSGTSDGSSPIGFFEDPHFCEEDKLALLNFLTQEFGLKQPAVLRGAESGVAAKFLVEQYSGQGIKIDILYLDAEALRSVAPTLMAQLYDLLSRKGVVCVESPEDAIEPILFPAEPFETVLAIPHLSIFARLDGERPIRSMRYQVDLFRRKRHFERKRKAIDTAKTDLPLVAVVILTYKHERYISECLHSVLRQHGCFRMRVIIIDDASPDETARVVQSIISKCRNDRIEIDFYPNTKNVGVVANIATAIRIVGRCDYLTFCEGDDFWSSEYRIREHIKFLRSRPESVMSFNSIEFCAEDGTSREMFADQANLADDTITGFQLARTNVVGNFSACFYDGALIDVIPQEMFQLYAVDWLFNLYCAQFGTIAHLRMALSVYRQHAGGEWSARPNFDKIIDLLGHINEYNAFLDFIYDEDLQEYRRRLYSSLAGNAKEGEIFDLIIFDDVFPSTRSAFRYTEITEYLRSFSRSLVLTSGTSLPVLEDRPMKDVIRSYHRQNSELAGGVMRYSEEFPLQIAKLVYMNFLANAYALIPHVEAARVPFVFTLYPGAGFALNDPECDSKLRRIFNSPCFQKVIVTQQVTYDYIVHRNLCPAEKVQMIFGVVMPPVEPVCHDKTRWGFGKRRLDVCFMAHRYTPYGADKGYDVFINVASILRQRHDDIYFHVVGPFDKGVIDVSSFRDRIKFYGSLDPQAFDGFFQGMDIIVSPNISGKIFPGSFDGFPTASCTEAGMRGVAIFAIDEFNSAAGRFTDGEDIVLLKYDLFDIVDKIEKYYSDPQALKKIGDLSIQKCRELYSFDAQMTPRIELLRHAVRERDLSSPNESRQPAVHSLATVRASARLGEWLRRESMKLTKRVYRAWTRNNASR